MAARARLAVPLAALIATVGCGAGGSGVRRDAARSLIRRSTGDGRPPLTAVVREGDPRGAVAFAVTTAGVAPDRGALAAVALAALMQERLAGRGIDVSAVGGWDGWRLRALIDSPADAARVVDAVRVAMLTPVAPGEPSLAGVARKASALALLPLPDPAVADVAACTGEAYAAGGGDAPNATILEAWRRAANGLPRVAIATVGDSALADAVAQALERAPAWPRAAAVEISPWPAANAPSVVYDASGELAPGAARIIVAARTASPERAVAAAPALGDPRGPLASRLAALDAPGRVTSVVATAHTDGGCVATTIDLLARDLTSDAPARIATAAALAREEIAVEIADGASPPDIGSELMRQAADPRDAAERAAWWSLAGDRPDALDGEPRTSLAVGVATPRDAVDSSNEGAAIRAEIDRITSASRVPVVEARTFVERGQGQTWVLLASQCGTTPEANGDAGVGAAVAMAAASQASELEADVQIEPIIGFDAIGLLAHGRARDTESPQAHARRLADGIARAFAADALSPTRIAQARATLLARGAEGDARTLASLASALVPGHPSWLVPAGTLFGLTSVSDALVAERAAAIRTGPLRVAVLANVDAAQANAAAQAVDRWVARRPGEARVCPPIPSVPEPRPGTYAVDLPAGVPSEVLVGISLPPVDDASRAAAIWTAAALDGADGLLAHALGGEQNSATLALASTWSAVVLGTLESSALVVRIVGSDATLDAAVAQVRALLDRLRHGALREEDRARAAVSLERARLAASLDPRERVIDLWRGRALSAPAPGAPSLEQLRSFAASALRDEAFVIVAARPPRADRIDPHKGRIHRDSDAKNRG